MKNLKKRVYNKQRQYIRDRRILNMWEPATFKLETSREVKLHSTVRELREAYDLFCFRLVSMAQAGGLTNVTQESIESTLFKHIPKNKCITDRRLTPMLLSIGRGIVTNFFDDTVFIKLLQDGFYDNSGFLSDLEYRRRKAALLGANDELAIAQSLCVDYIEKTIFLLETSMYKVKNVFYDAGVKWSY